MKNKLKFFTSISLKRRRSINGYLYISPFLLGFILFVLVPIIQSIIFSLTELSITIQGYELEYVGLNNFIYALTVDAEFARIFVETSFATFLRIPAILIFAFFIAVLLNQKFKGRFLARTIFFLPVILTAGVVVEMQMGDQITNEMMGLMGLGGGEVTSTEAVGMMGETGGDGGGLMLTGSYLEGILEQIQFPEQIIEYVIMITNQLPEILDNAAIPIIIFLAGLQSIPNALYECARMEGATSWETFWHVTFPLVSPLMLTNIVYIIINSFTAMDNELVQYISEAAWGRGIYGATTAMSWMYFVSIALFLLIVGGLISKKVFYME